MKRNSQFCPKFAGLKLPTGKTTVMHLVSRETVPEPQSAGRSNVQSNLNLLSFQDNCVKVFGFQAFFGSSTKLVLGIAISFLPTIFLTPLLSLFVGHLT